MSEPIAIVGMACKFPGAPDLESFWSLLESGGNAITEGVPGSGVGRIGQFYPESANQYPACRFAALVDGIDLFDAEFFRISPVEAQLLDPQQRMLLETCWTALEDALVDPEKMRGTRTGVYVGISNNDYRGISLDAGQPTEPAASLYTVSGTSFNTAAGRVAFALGLEGPAMAVDTACSSSLFALHQAIASLQRDEADMMLVGGVQAIFLGRLTELRAKAGMLSPDGQCKAFDAAANGFVRGEGCGIVALKRLSDAEADGDRIWGTVLGSAVNQDGTSTGLTVPSQAAQGRVIEEALLQARVEPHEVDYLEAHGTGTEVGDPIELNAAADVYGRGRHADNPLLVGSVKTNVGHLEPAAGVAGLMKVMLSMQQGVIPKHLHFNNPNPRLDWGSLPVRITTESTKWPLAPQRPPRAGISSYGWSGTNVHVVVEGPAKGAQATTGPRGMPRPAGPARAIAARTPDSTEVGPAEGGQEGRRNARILPISGKSDSALRELARSYLSQLDENRQEGQAEGDAPGLALADLAWTASMARSHFEHREGIVFRDSESLLEGLQVVAGDMGAVSSQAAGKVAFVYTGQGNQWVGMGEVLYRSEPVFRATLDRCDQLIRAERGESLIDVMFGRAGAAGELDEPQWTQPAIYALECALTDLWASVGIRPTAVLGHSLGEIAAAYAAGVFTLEGGLRYASERGRLMGQLPRAGGMAAVFAPVEDVAAAVAEWNEEHPGADICVGVDNGTHQVVSGPAAEVDAFSEHLEAAGRNVRRLRASPAYHSSLVEPALDELEAVFADVPVSLPAVPLISNVTGQAVAPDSRMDGPYWRTHARQPVAFKRCVETLADMGIDTVIEVGPHAILGPLVSLNWPEGNGKSPAPIVLQSLLAPARDGSEPERADAFVCAVAGAYKIGLPVAFEGLFAGEERRRVPVPGYPFQRRRFWVQSSRTRRAGGAHPLLGTRHESPRGELMFETEMFPSDPHWLNDHKVFDRVVMPGAVYGAMAATVQLIEGDPEAVVEELQLHSPLVYPKEVDDAGLEEHGRSVQLIIDARDGTRPRQFEVFSKGRDDKAWTLHAAGQVVQTLGKTRSTEWTDLDSFKAKLKPQDLSSYYRSKAATGINFGPRLRTLEALWGDGNDAVGQINLNAAGDTESSGIHPLLLDGCFQVLSAARSLSGIGDTAAYLPFGWERLWLNGPLPNGLVCHANLRDTGLTEAENGTSAPPPETLTGDLRLYAPDGNLIGELTGLALKRATRASLLPVTEGLQDLLYEIAWRERPLTRGLRSADGLSRPSQVAASLGTFAEYLMEEGVEVNERADLLDGLERLSRSYALTGLERLGWRRKAGEEFIPDSMLEGMQVIPEHSRLLDRMFRLAADAKVLEATPTGYRVVAGAEDPLPDDALADPEGFADQLSAAHPHGINEVGLLRRSGAALAEVLRGDVDPLSILFPREGPGAADFYFTAPSSRASNHILADAVAAAVVNWPKERRLRILEVGAGTGSGTSVVLPQLPQDRFEYVFTDISAGFFSEAENRFRDDGAAIEYRRLDIERDPGEQGFDLHSYDMVIAVNVLHATRNLAETLTNCRNLLAPSGQLLAVESLKGRGWQDMTFGQLDGWWRYSDGYRPNHAIASPDVWLRALADTKFEDSSVLGGESTGHQGPLGSGVILGQGPRKISLPGGVWVLATDGGETVADLAASLAVQNQTVVLAGPSQEEGPSPDGPGVFHARLDAEQTASWIELFRGLPQDMLLQGVMHCAGLQGHGTEATTEQLADDVTNSGASALALVQALLSLDLAPDRGLWFMTKGCQALEQDYLKTSTAELAGATLWGIGKVVAREAGHLQPRMIDLDPNGPIRIAELTNEVLFPDPETHIAYRSDRRLAARLIRKSEGRPRLSVPEEGDWKLSTTAGQGLDGLHIEASSPQPLNAGEVRVAVEAVGLNFSDVLISVGAVEMEPMLGDEFCGRITEVAPDVSEFVPGDRVVGLGIGTFRPELVTRGEMVAAAPPEMPASALATIPTSFVSAELGLQMSGLTAGDRVLVHTASGGVGLAAIQLVRAAGAEVFATASTAKQEYLRALGIIHVYDSRSTDFAKGVMAETGGAGVSVVLNSLTGPGFIEASLSCVASGGRFVEMGRRDIWSVEEMAAARPDVAYSVLEVDALKRRDPAVAGASLKRVMARLETGELQPLVHTSWPVAEVGTAMDFMRLARHIGKNVITMPPLNNGQLRRDRSYLVTGGLGGIGCVVARWLADHGAGVIVLNGRRPPDKAAEETIAAIRAKGVDVRVELADMTDAAAIDAMLNRIDDQMAPLGGVVHSVGVLSDAALSNQTWDRFEKVLRPKVLGAWHLHRATMVRDLDLFVLFSSVTGVLGNPGQGNHAAANAFLDQLAGYRRALGLPGQSIAWGAWSGLGEAEEHRERIERQLEASGTGWVSPEQGLKAFDEMVRQGVTTSMVAAVDWKVFADNLERENPLLEALVSDASDSVSEGAADADANVLSRLRENPAADWEPLLVTFVQDEVQAVLRLPKTPPTNVGFFDLGMDSLMSVELRNRLNRAFAGEYVVSNTAVFDYPNAAALAKHLTGELVGPLGSREPQSAGQPAPAQPRRDTKTEDEPIAIIGMACRFPGAADLASFWDLLESGRNAITDGRTDAGPWEGVAGDPGGDDPLYRTGGFVDDIDRFDNRFFRISPIEARMMDPQQRMLLETAWQALEDAGVNPDTLRGSLTGVYVGIGGSEYRDVIAAKGQEELYFGTTGSMAAGRLAFILGLEGPAMPVDMACASSLAVVHQATAALQRGEVDLALAGGVNAILSPSVVRFHRELGMLSAAGRCNAFDASADGFVRSEGCGVMALKRLSEAEADGDRIWAVIRGSAVNQNGASAGLPVPRGPAQERLIEETLARAGVQPHEVDFVEAHGTGTELGDSIELNALASVYGRGREADRPLLVGSVKTNIGHSEWAAGMASIMKAILAMKNGVIPAHLHFQNPNPNFDWDRMPVRITSEATEWPVVAERPALAAANSFGLSGTNAHVIVEGYGNPAKYPGAGGQAAWPAGQAMAVSITIGAPFDDLSAPSEAAPERSVKLLPLSGKSRDALRVLARAYLDWLKQRAPELSSEKSGGQLLADMAWTASVGRSHFAHRAGLVFRNVEELQAGLEALASSQDESVDAEPAAASQSAFVYTGSGELWAGMGKDLYQREPAFRTVLDKCDEIVCQERGSSLLDVMFARDGASSKLNDGEWGPAAIYALEAALTALWQTAGVRPGSVFGVGVGETSAALTAGVFGLEDGLRLVMAMGKSGATLPGVAMSEPSVPLFSSSTGTFANRGDKLAEDHWRRLQVKEDGFPYRTFKAADTSADIVVALGPQAKPEWMQGLKSFQDAQKARAGQILDCLLRPGDDPEGPDVPFLHAVAKAYEAGLSVSFDGLFAGEHRRRIGIPGYPFERRSFWVQERRRRSG